MGRSPKTEGAIGRNADLIDRDGTSQGPSNHINHFSGKLSWGIDNMEQVPTHLQTVSLPPAGSLSHGLRRASSLPEGAMGADLQIVRWLLPGISGYWLLFFDRLPGG